MVVFEKIFNVGRSETMKSPVVNKKSIEVGQLFSLKTVSNIQEKAFTIPKTISDS